MTAGNQETRNYEPRTGQDAPTFVLVHGGQHTSRCWDLLRPQLGHDSVAVDLPGRPGATRNPPAPRIADYVAAITDAVDAATGPVVLIGHSASGPAVAMAAGERPDAVARVVFLASLLPEPGTDGLDSLPAPLRNYVRSRSGKPGKVNVLGNRGWRAAVARWLLCNDMDATTTRLALDGLVPETSLQREPFDYPEAFRSLPRTYVCLLRDRVVRPRQALGILQRLQPVEVAFLDAGHNAMLSQPARLAGLLELIVGRTRA